jgi:hypothetical protein
LLNNQAGEWSTESGGVGEEGGIEMEKKDAPRRFSIGSAPLTSFTKIR